MIIFDQRAILGPQFLHGRQPLLDACLAEDTLDVRAEKAIVVGRRPIRFR